MARYPYICLITRNSHTHHPPYPIKLPIDLANDVVEAIRQEEVLSLTTRMPRICTVYANETTYHYIGRFILSPQYYILCRKYGAQTLRAVHSSLNIEDRITALIRKERMLQFPEGTAYAGKYMLDTRQVYTEPKCGRCTTRVLY
jgi:hypothetical protein